jgi:hypothetical protein
MAPDVPAGRAARITPAGTRPPPRARYLPIAEHGLIGDLHTVALVGSDGRTRAGSPPSTSPSPSWSPPVSSTRYNVEASPEGLAGQEATYSMCSSVGAVMSPLNSARGGPTMPPMPRRPRPRRASRPGFRAWQGPRGGAGSG